MAKKAYRTWLDNAKTKIMKLQATMKKGLDASDTTPITYGGPLATISQAYDQEMLHDKEHATQLHGPSITLTHAATNSDSKVRKDDTPIQ